jgi:hypothetical protein
VKQVGQQIRAFGLVTVLNIVFFVQLLAGLVSRCCPATAAILVKSAAQAVSRVFGLVADMQLALQLGREIQALSSNSMFTACLDMCLRLQIAAPGADIGQVLETWRLLKPFDILPTVVQLKDLAVVSAQPAVAGAWTGASILECFQALDSIYNKKLPTGQLVKAFFPISAGLAMQPLLDIFTDRLREDKATQAQAIQLIETCGYLRIIPVSLFAHLDEPGRFDFGAIQCAAWWCMCRGCSALLRLV